MTSLYWICIFYYSVFLSNLRLPWKFSLWWIYFFQDFWATCACPEKHRVPWLHCSEYVFFIVQYFWATCACPEKQLPWNFSLYWNIFYHSGFLSNSRLPWKNRVAPKIFTVVNILYFLHSGFLTTCACPENRVSPAIFHCTEYTFYIQDFWVTCACPKKQKGHWIHCTEYVFFIIQDFWATRACPEKQSCPGIFNCI